MVELVELLDDPALAQQLLASAGGDSAAEQELCRRFAPRIRLYGLRHLRDEDAADDLVQEVLLRVLAAIRARRLADPSHIVGFVLGTCRHVASNARRADSRRQRLLEEHAADLLDRNEPRPAEPVADLDRLRECLATLPPRWREILHLTFHGEEKAEPIAAKLGVTPGHVRVIRHRALARLRHCLTGEVGPPGAGR